METDYLLVFDSIGLDTRKSGSEVFTRNPFIKAEELAEVFSESMTLPPQYYDNSLIRYRASGLWDYNFRGFEQALFMLTFLRNYWVTPIEFCCNQYAGDFMFDSLLENVKNVESATQRITLIKLSQLCSARLRPFGPLLLDKLGLGSKPAAKIASIMVLLGIDFGLVSSFLRQTIIQSVFRKIEQDDSYLINRYEKSNFERAVEIALSVGISEDEKYSLHKLTELYKAYKDYRKFFYVIDTLNDGNFKCFEDLDLGADYLKYLNTKSIFSFKRGGYRNTLWLQQVIGLLGKKGYYSLPERK